MKLVKSIAATAASLVVALTSAVVAQPSDNTAHEAYCEKVGATVDEVFDYAASFEGWKLYDFRANGWNTNDSYWCAWYASTMLLDCNVPFPVPDFNLRIWVADILAGYLDEGRYIHTASSTTGFISQGGGKEVTSDMLLRCQDESYSPKHGDLLFFDWEGDGLPDHIGFVDYTEGEIIHCLEGNPGYLDGEFYNDLNYNETKVGFVPRDKKCIIGYAKPDYISVDSEPADAACDSEIVESTEATAPKMIKLKFTVDEGIFCDEHDREITWGTCTYDFPTPYKPNAKFLGWFDVSGNNIDCNSLITDDIELYARFDDIIETTSSHSKGDGRHEEQFTTEETTEVVAIADDVDVQRDDIYHPVRVTEPPVQEMTLASEPVTERTPVRVQSVSLSRTSKMLNTVGGSTGFTLTANVSPSDAEDKRLTFTSSNSGIARVDRNGNVFAVSDGTCYITVTAANGVSASCEVNVKTAYNKTCGAWSAYSETPVSPSSTVEVESYNTTKQVLDRYRCVYYCTKDLDGNRIYDSKSRNGDFSGRNTQYKEWSFAVQLGDPQHDFWDYTPGELSNPIAPGGYLNSNQSGYNGSDQTLYTATWGNDVILVAIKDSLYKDVPVTMYRYRSITSSPVEYN